MILLAQACDTTNIVYHHLSKQFSIEFVIVEERVPVTTFLGRRLRKLGFFAVAGQLMFRVCVVPVLKFLGRQRLRQIVGQYGLDISPIPSDKTLNVKSVNDPQCAALLNRLQPDCILVNGTRIIAASTLSAVDSIFINIHAGITPMFRGVHGGYWAMASERKELFGTTIHFVDQGIDTGKVIKQVIGTPEKKDNFCTYPYLQYAIILDELTGLCRKIMGGEPIIPAAPLVKESKLWSHPTLYEWIKNSRYSW